MYYYIAMSENTIVKKPIEEIRDMLNEIKNDISNIKTDISHIKDYIKRDEVRKSIEYDKMKKEENEYVGKSKGWWYN